MSTTDENVLARQWRGQVPIIALFQFAGLFFILFYYPELLFKINNSLAPDYSLHDSVNVTLLWIFERTNKIQLLLSVQYHYLILAALAATSAILALIAVTTLRRMDFSVFLRAVFFLVLGLLAIPTVLLAYVLRWVPVAIFSFFASIYRAIASVFAFLSPYIGWVIISIVTITVVVTVVIALARIATGRIVLTLAIVMGGSLLFFPELLNAVTTIAVGAWSVTVEIAAYPIAVLGYVFGFIVAALAFIVSALLVLLPSMFVISQFGHIFIDSLFDARNVRRSARAAGRFLVGIGCHSMLTWKSTGSAWCGAGLRHGLRTLWSECGLRGRCRFFC